MQGVGAFSERGVFENALYRFEDVPVHKMYLYGSTFFYQQINISQV